MGEGPFWTKWRNVSARTWATSIFFLLYGLGGAGKTQIALKFIELSSRFSDIFLIDTSTTATIETGLQSIAGSTAQDALKWLSRKQDRWLLFFDNADDPTINLNSFFPRCNHGNIIITSRNHGLKVYAGSHVLVSDMEEADAVKLLLTSAAQDVTESNKKIAVEIVQELSCLPLAIIQAGSFISESGALNSYLTLFRQNWARLLSKKPAQSHDDYAGTVYTTWQISFDRLTGAAQTLLQLCSFLHHQGIFEQIFSLASAYTFPAYGPSKEELQRPMELLSPFLGSNGDWDSLQFIEVTNELQAYSLINFNPETGLFSIHPLVHGWSRSTLTSEKEYHHSMVAIVGMMIERMPSLALEPASLWLTPHTDSLRGSEIYVNPDFNHAFASIYRYSKRPAEAAKIKNVILQKQRETLGDDHPDTLSAMWSLATSYNHIHQPKKAEELLLVLLENRKRTLGDNHLYTVKVMAEMSVVCSQLGQLQHAKELQVVVLEKYKEILGEDHPDTLRAMGNLAWAYLNLGQFNSSAELQAAVLEK
ncbi:P-loop containing nucleoside triphosphate hydrolase protein [Mycena galericulata]|nr:P-loop containing nucleoside triphosphate hydrolase protein [Mycena galericulata]